MWEYNKKDLEEFADRFNRTELPTALLEIDEDDEGEHYEDCPRYDKKPVPCICTDTEEHRLWVAEEDERLGKLREEVEKELKEKYGDDYLELSAEKQMDRHVEHDPEYDAWIMLDQGKFIMTPACRKRVLGNMETIAEQWGVKLDE